MEKLFLIKLLVFLCIFLNIVAVAFCHVEKRDVHRIILSERRPRSHRSHHKYKRNNHHHHPQHHEDFGSEENQRKREKHREKYRKREHNQSFEEDSDGYFGNQDHGYENTSSYKGSRHSRRRKPLQRRPASLFTSAEFEDFNKASQFQRGEWTPLLSSESSPLHFSSSVDSIKKEHDSRYKRKPRKEKKKFNPSSPLNIELTTKYPTHTTLPFYTAFHNAADFINFNQKTFDLQSEPLLITDVGFQTYQGNSYEVHEHNKDSEDYIIQEQPFQVLGPALELTSSKVRDKAEQENNVGRISNQQVKKQTKDKGRKRGTRKFKTK